MKVLFFFPTKITFNDIFQRCLFLCLKNIGSDVFVIVTQKMLKEMFILESEESGEEVGFPDVRIVGLYRGVGNKSNTLYYINSENGEILKTFIIRG